MKTKLTFLISSLKGGGAERVLSTIVNELIHLNYEITIITYQEGNDYNLDKRIKIIEGARGTTLLGRIKKLSFFIFRLFFLLKKEKTDVLIPFMQGMNRKGILLSYLLNIPVIVSEHTNYKTTKNIFMWLERRFIYKLADAVIVLTHYDKDNYYGKFLNNVNVIPNPNSYDSITEIKVRDNSIVVMGSLNRWEIKGFDNIIQIFSNIVKKHPNWILKIIGRGDVGLAVLKGKVIELGIENNVHFLGFCSNVDEVIRESPIFVMSSRYEGFAMALSEAMSQGCACVSYNCVAGPSEIITNNVDGLLVKDQDHIEMQKQISHLIENPDLRLKLAHNAYLNIEKFSTEKIIPQWISVIDKVKKT